jgi:hypothetical protein
LAPELLLRLALVDTQTLSGQEERRCELANIRTTFFQRQKKFGEPPWAGCGARALPTRRAIVDGR